MHVRVSKMGSEVERARSLSLFRRRGRFFSKRKDNRKRTQTHSFCSFFFLQNWKKNSQPTDDRPDLQHRRDNPPRPGPSPQGQEGRGAVGLPRPLQARAAQQARRAHRLRRSDPGDAPRRREDPGEGARGTPARARCRAGVYGGGPGVGGVEVVRPELRGEIIFLEDGFRPPAKEKKT